VRDIRNRNSAAAPPRPGVHLASGLAYSTSAYAVWGIVPLYFILLIPAGPFEITAWRILAALAICALLLSLSRGGWRRFAAVWRSGRVIALLAVASFLVAINWFVFIIASIDGYVVEASLGYFINPIFTVALGVFILRERLRWLQWTAIGLSVASVVVLTFAHGSVPWIGLLLASTFAVYGLIKNRLGGQVDATSGLTVETAVMAPIAILALIVVALGVPGFGGEAQGLTFGSEGVWHALLLLGSGVLTAAPLLFFAAATRRLPLSYVGLTQYLAPILQFVLGVSVLGEQMAPERWIGFAIVWLAVLCLIIDAVISIVKSRRRARS